MRPTAQAVDDAQRNPPGTFRRFAPRSVLRKLDPSGLEPPCCFVQRHDVVGRSVSSGRADNRRTSPVVRSCDFRPPPQARTGLCTAHLAPFSTAHLSHLRSPSCVTLRNLTPCCRPHIGVDHRNLPESANCHPPPPKINGINAGLAKSAESHETGVPKLGGGSRSPIAIVTIQRMRWTGSARGATLCRSDPVARAHPVGRSEHRPKSRHCASRLALFLRR